MGLEDWSLWRIENWLKNRKQKDLVFVIQDEKLNCLIPLGSVLRRDLKREREGGLWAKLIRSYFG